jgi:hypothetical protein
VQDRRADGTGDIGPVVDGEQGAVSFRRRREQFEQPDLVAGLESLLAQLDDVDAPGENRVQELFEVAGARPGVGTQVQAGVIYRGHAARVV